MVSSWENVYYLTGARSIYFYVKGYDPMPFVISPGRDPVFFTNMMFGMAAKLEHKYLKDVRPCEAAALWPQVSALLKEWKVKRLGIESRYLSASHADAVRKSFGEIELVDATDLVENVRMVKTAEELDYLKKASQISDKIAGEIVEYLKPGKTEMEVARAIIGLTVEYGGEESSFHPQVFSGRRGYLLNISSSDEKKLQKGEVIMLDYGAVCKGYRTDITRAYVLGPPTARHIEVNKKVIEITRDTMDFVRAGRTASEIHLFALKKFKDVGYPDSCRHYSGHGLGISLERPTLREFDHTEIKENMVLAVEQGLYFPDFGIRYEDNIIVTKGGYDNMNKSPWDLVVLD
jgi:Xaa-Pro aminopeptidase